MFLVRDCDCLLWGLASEVRFRIQGPGFPNEAHGKDNLQA